MTLNACSLLHTLVSFFFALTWTVGGSTLICFRCQTNNKTWFCPNLTRSLCLSLQCPSMWTIIELITTLLLSLLEVMYRHWMTLSRYQRSPDTCSDSSMSVCPPSHSVMTITEQHVYLRKLISENPAIGVFILPSAGAWSWLYNVQATMSLCRSVMLCERGAAKTGHKKVYVCAARRGLFDICVILSLYILLRPPPLPHTQVVQPWPWSNILVTVVYCPCCLYC